MEIFYNFKYVSLRISPKYHLWFIFSPLCTNQSHTCFENMSLRKVFNEIFKITLQLDNLAAHLFFRFKRD